MCWPTGHFRAKQNACMLQLSCCWPTAIYAQTTLTKKRESGRVRREKQIKSSNCNVMWFGHTLFNSDDNTEKRQQ